MAVSLRTAWATERDPKCRSLSAECPSSVEVILSRNLLGHFLHITQISSTLSRNGGSYPSQGCHSAQPPTTVWTAMPIFTVSLGHRRNLDSEVQEGFILGN